jgi:NADH dehydrogenase FAD-containing subunit
MATGPEGHSLIKNSDILQDDDHFFLVNNYLQSKQYSNVFGGGDCINLIDC